MAISIIYGSYTIPFIMDKFRESDSYRHYRIDVDILITGTTDLLFKTALAAAEVALNADSQRLQVKFGTETHRDFNPATYSGLKARASLSKSGDEADTARSRKYTWTCDIDLPASSAADLYRREATWQLSYNESRRAEITFQGTYTAGSSNTAKTNYDAQVGTWISSVFTALGETESFYELLPESITAEDDENAILSFSLTYREILFNESSAALNNSAIKNAIATFARSYVSEGAVLSVSATYIDITYSCNVDCTDGTYGSVALLDDLWADVILPHLLTQAKTIWGGAFAVIESENTTLNPSEFTIQSSLRILTASSSGVISYTESIEIDNERQWTYQKLLDGKKHTYSFWSPGERLTATQTIEIKKIGGLPGAPETLKENHSVMAKMIGLSGLRGSWNLDGETARYIPSNIGLDPDGASDTKSTHTVSFVRRYTFLASEGDGRIVTGSGQIGYLTGL